MNAFTRISSRTLTRSFRYSSNILKSSENLSWRHLQKRSLRIHYSDDEDSDGDDEFLDYRLLLLDSIVHQWEKEDGDIFYCLGSKHLDVDAIKSRPEMQLASLMVTPSKRELHSAKVINHKKVGKVHKACHRLVEKALNDIGSGATARSTIYGLSNWVLAGIEDFDHPAASFLQELDPADFFMAEAFATGFVEEEFTPHRFELWARLARKYIELDLGGEPTLYRSNGGRLIEVQNLADMSPTGRYQSGAAFAIFDFPTFLPNGANPLGPNHPSGNPSGANPSGATPSGANPSAVKPPGASLSGAKPSGADSSDANSSGANS